MPGRRVEVDAVPVVVIDSLDQVRALGERILDAARAEPVVCVTTRHNAPKPLLDVETVAAAVAPLPIHVLGTGELTWELNAILPERFEVYGGASRIWWPGLRPTDDARRHPLIFCWADYEAPEAARRVLRELDRWGLAVERGALGSPPATTFPFRSSPVSVEPVAPVAGPLEGVGVHDVVEATVVEVQRGGTEVELAGGLRCLILTKRGRPAPAVRRGDVVPVKVIAVNSAAGSVEVRWIAETSSPPTATTHLLAPPGESPIPPPRAGPPAPSPLDLARRQSPDLLAGPVGADSGGTSLAFRLAADEVQPEVRQARADVDGLRAAAQRIARELDAAVEAARVRVSEFTRSQVGDILENLQAELADARNAARELRLQLEAAEHDKRGAITEMRKLRERLTDAAKELRSKRDSHEHTKSQLYGRGAHSDAETQFRHEVSVACDRLGAGSAGADGAVGRARDYVLGPDFLASLDGLQGMDRSQVVEKIAAMLTDALPGRVHPLRTTEAGNAPTRIRASDGAKAYRFYLQHKSNAARRLHYWQLPDGRIELANVAVHDDIAIR